MSVEKGKRRQSRFEAAHHYIKVRNEVTLLMLQDFGFSREKYEKQIEKYAHDHRNSPNVQEIVGRWRKKADSFHRWFIDRECDAVSDILRRIDAEFTMANSIYPSSKSEFKTADYCQRRKHMNEAIAECYVLKSEINYVIRTLPVDINKYKHFATMIDEQIALLKGVRKADNRFL